MLIVEDIDNRYIIFATMPYSEVTAERAAEDSFGLNGGAIIVPSRLLRDIKAWQERLAQSDNAPLQQQLAEAMVEQAEFTMQLAGYAALGAIVSMTEDEAEYVGSMTSGRYALSQFLGSAPVWEVLGRPELTSSEREGETDLLLDLGNDYGERELSVPRLFVGKKIARLIFPHLTEAVLSEDVWLHDRDLGVYLHVSSKPEPSEKFRLDLARHYGLELAQTVLADSGDTQIVPYASMSAVLGNDTQPA